MYYCSQLTLWLDTVSNQVYDSSTSVATCSNATNDMYLTLQDFFSRCCLSFQNNHKKILEIEKLCRQGNIFLNKHKQSKKLTLYSEMKILQEQYL
ncbi:MAG: hypothetical protein RLZZ507_2415 [Cyanobacteriota bacterium]|jgi:hypothetical protein